MALFLQYKTNYGHNSVAETVIYIFYIYYVSKFLDFSSELFHFWVPTRSLIKVTPPDQRYPPGPYPRNQQSQLDSPGHEVSVLFRPFASGV